MDAPADEAPPYKLVDILPMAYPKGQAPVCEMTGLPAKIKCETEHITLYYNNRETAEESWHGIMCKIAPLLGPLRPGGGQVLGGRAVRARAAGRPAGDEVSTGV